MKFKTTSASLLTRVRDPADTAAWREFDARYGDLIVRFSCRMGLQHPDAEDIRQVVMIRLAKALRTFHYRPQRGRFRSYLGRVVRNEIARHLTRPNHLPATVQTEDGPLEDAPDRVGAAESWEQEWMLHHLRLAMRQVRQTYDPRSLDVFEQLLAGKPVQEIATGFAMTTQAVHKVKQRIRDRLQQIVTDQIRDEDEVDG